MGIWRVRHYLLLDVTPDGAVDEAEEVWWEEDTTEFGLVTEDEDEDEDEGGWVEEGAGEDLAEDEVTVLSGESSTSPSPVR